MQLLNLWHQHQYPSRTTTTTTRIVMLMNGLVAGVVRLSGSRWLVLLGFSQTQMRHCCAHGREIQIPRCVHLARPHVSVAGGRSPDVDADDVMWSEWLRGLEDADVKEGDDHSHPCPYQTAPKRTLPRYMTPVEINENWQRCPKPKLRGLPGCMAQVALRGGLSTKAIIPSMRDALSRGR